MAWVTVGVATAGAIAGKMKNDAAKEREAKDVQLASATQRYSPWTGMSAQPVQHANSAGGDIFGGAVGGAMAGQSLSNGMAGMSKPQGTAMAGGPQMSPDEAMQKDIYGNPIGGNRTPTMIG